MKRLIVYILTLGFVEALATFLRPAAEMAVKTTQLKAINGGDADFVASRAIDTINTWPIAFLLFALITVLFWMGPFKKFLKEDPANPTK